MRKFYIIFLFLFLSGIGEIYGQQIPLKHTVQANETKYGLAKKYNITIQELERQNPHIVMMLQKGHELTIQSKGSNFANNISTNLLSSNENLNTYEVKPGETLYGIARKYKISIAELIEKNESDLGTYLQIGQILKIPVKKEPKQENFIGTDFQSHVVLAGETKYGLSKRFGITINELEQLNPQIVDMLRTGQQINYPSKTVSKTNEVVKNESVVIADKPISKKENVSQPEKSVQINPSTKNLISYEVKPKETLYGLTKMTGLSQEELTVLNPDLANGVKTGMILNIPSDSKISTEIVNQNLSIISEKELLNAIKKNVVKEVAFLTPFSEQEFQNYLKSPKNSSELNSNFEYYTGASMAIDSLKKSNVLVNSKLLKIQESDNSEINLSNLEGENIQNYNAVFCILNDYNFEEAGNYLAKNNIPFILSEVKETTVTATSTYVSLPSKTHLGKLILDYLVSQNGNLIIINDPSRVESKNFISENYPDAKFVEFTENGFLNSESLKSLLSSSKKNYVVLDTDEAGLILSSTTSLLKDSNVFDIQIALLEPKEVLKGEGLSDMRFKALKMIHPSINKPSEFSEFNRFKKSFFQKFGFNPTLEALKGFDITFDALVRMFQEKDFETLAKEQTTEQINYKFKYVKNMDEGYLNQGGYILQFDENSNNKIIN